MDKGLVSIVVPVSSQVLPRQNTGMYISVTGLVRLMSMALVPRATSRVSGLRRATLSLS